MSMTTSSRMRARRREHHCRLRFPEVQRLVQTAIQILMLIASIFWSADNLTGVRQFVFVQLNLIYRFINIVRAPLLATAPLVASYAAALAITAVGWCLAFLMFRIFSKRICYRS